MTDDERWWAMMKRPSASMKRSVDGEQPSHPSAHAGACLRMPFTNGA
jgi:hypothetical protein